MARILKKRSVKSGLPPGSLVYVGDKAAEQATVTVMEFGDGVFREEVVTSLDACLPSDDPSTV
ncbi:MAG TPA: magnesium and cobalt transport protein CorA, partial [Geobacteraceae bacterium]|nr:magnesium and cobalt transport protein CorA [Geobacteraceae bacterium]